jgi:hypothetical protein
MLCGTRETDTPKERSSSPREARSAPRIAYTPARDDVGHLRLRREVQPAGPCDRARFRTYIHARVEPGVAERCEHSAMASSDASRRARA